MIVYGYCLLLDILLLMNKMLVLRLVLYICFN